jgi:hypothetical protein
MRMENAGVNYKEIFGLRSYFCEFYPFRRVSGINFLLYWAEEASNSSVISIDEYPSYILEVASSGHILAELSHHFVGEAKVENKQSRREKSTTGLTLKELTTIVV